MPGLPPRTRRIRRWVIWCVFLATCGVVTATVLQQSRSLAVSYERSPLFDSRVAGGTLMIVGGGSVPPEIRRRFVELAGGAKARILLLPATNPQPGDEERWLAPFRALEPASVQLLDAETREVAEESEFLAQVGNATGIWFGGGNQSYLAERYVDSAVEGELHQLLGRGGVIGGTSAGAAILSRVMIAGGDHEPTESRGLGLLSEAIIDQHFLRRNRFWRLQQLLSVHPELVGLGIDERTALVVHVRTDRLQVLGDSYTVVCIPGGFEMPMRLEVLKPGDDTSLTQLREGHLPYRPTTDWDEVLAAP